jgi:hypothetical protein
MLDLNVPTRTVGGVDLAVDEQDRLAFYVLPPPPRVASVDGRPQLELLRFVRDGALFGGHLRMAVELAHPPGRLDAARSALVEQLRDEAVLLRPVPVTEATAELLFVGRETNSEGGLTELLHREYGRVAARLEAPHTATFAVSLTADGVRLVEAALRSGGAPLGIIYRLQVEGLWPAQRVIARVDWSRVYHHVSLHWKEGALLAVEDIRKTAEQLMEHRAITVQVVQGLVAEDGGTDIDPAAAIAWIQRELVERFCEPVMELSREPAHASLGTAGEIVGVGTSFAAKKLTQVEHAVAQVDFQRAIVVKRTLTAHAHLADLLSGASPDAHIADVGTGHPFFERFTLRVQTARSLAESHVSELVLHFGYGTVQESLRLTREAPEGQVETWADAATDRTWTLRPEVTVAADAPVDAGRHLSLPPLTGQGRELTLDVDRLLGLTRVDVFGPSEATIAMTLVALRHTRGGEACAEREIALTPQAPKQSAWFIDYAAGDRMEARAKYLLADGRLIEGDRVDVDTRVLRVPPPFRTALTVQLFADDDWSDLDRVVVSLQKRSDLLTGTFVFDQPGQALAVNLDMPEPFDRAFRYRMTRTWSSGAVEEDDWVATDVPVVLVGRVAAHKLSVELTPVGLELPEAGIALIEVDLSYIDAEHQVRDVRTEVIRARADRIRWEPAIRDPGRRSYQYRITVHRTSGERTVGPWTSSTARILPIPVTMTPSG